MIEFVDISDDFNNFPRASRDYPKRAVTFAEVFCGAGGFSLGLIQAGWTSRVGVDFDKAAAETYQFNINRDHTICGDITQSEIKERFYKECSEGIDVLVGGFPCQGFSMAGKRQRDDPRNSLYKQMLEIAEVLRPKIVIGENVGGLRAMDGIEMQIKSDFAELGYSMDSYMLNSADFYVPQKRKRIIFIGNRLNVPNMYPKPLLTEDKYLTVEYAVGDMVGIEDNLEWNHRTSAHSEEFVNKMGVLAEGDHLYPNYANAWFKPYWNRPSPTVMEAHGFGFVHPKLPRTMSPRELARLQSFPDWFIFKGGRVDWFKQIGNAVPPLMGQAVGLAAMKMLETKPIMASGNFSKSFGNFY